MGIIVNRRNFPNPSATVSQTVSSRPYVLVLAMFLVIVTLRQSGQWKGGVGSPSSLVSHPSPKGFESETWLRRGGKEVKSPPFSTIKTVSHSFKIISP